LRTERFEVTFTGNLGPSSVSPAWHLVESLASLVSPDGNTPVVDHYLDKVRPVSAAEKAMIDEAAKRQSEELLKKQLGVQPLGTRCQLPRVAGS
jgi:hypothetical protein